MYESMPHALAAFGLSTAVMIGTGFIVYRVISLIEWILKRKK